MDWPGRFCCVVVIFAARFDNEIKNNNRTKDVADAEAVLCMRWLVGAWELGLGVYIELVEQIFGFLAFCC